jgi:hypothetical protein
VRSDGGKNSEFERQRSGFDSNLVGLSFLLCQAGTQQLLCLLPVCTAEEQMALPFAPDVSTARQVAGGGAVGGKKALWPPVQKLSQIQIFKFIFTC